jgi:hypothetical protein
MSAEKISELQLQLEQSRRERDEAHSLAVEVQVLREKNIRLLAAEQNMFNLQQKNSELNRSVMELQRHVKDTTELYAKSMNHHNDDKGRLQYLKLSSQSDNVVAGGSHDAQLNMLNKQVKLKFVSFS